MFRILPIVLAVLAPLSGWKGKPLGVAKLEDRRALIDRTEPQSLAYVMQQGAWRFGLTYQGREYIPVLIQALFVDEFGRAGLAPLRTRVSAG